MGALPTAKRCAHSHYTRAARCPVWMGRCTALKTCRGRRCWRWRSMQPVAWRTCTHASLLCCTATCRARTCWYVLRLMTSVNRWLLRAVVLGRWKRCAARAELWLVHVHVRLCQFVPRLWRYAHESVPFCMRGAAIGAPACAWRALAIGKAVGPRSARARAGAVCWLLLLLFV